MIYFWDNFRIYLEKVLNISHESSVARQNLIIHIEYQALSFFFFIFPFFKKQKNQKMDAVANSRYAFKSQSKDLCPVKDGKQSRSFLMMLHYNYSFMKHAHALMCLPQQTS